MKLDLTVTITAILGIAAIISPIATALINNRHQLKLKKLEYQQKDYLKYTSECITYSTQDALQKYGEIYGLALIYFPEDLIEDMEELNRIMRNSSPEERMSLFNKLAPKIRAILQNM